ncbi:MAG: 4-hydroxy-3-methylbut-2-en-1-yl diphosphate synthase [Bacillota bacterium]|nr:MAG: 4-hydroxy-3-methylbut-2-en-1-yl diphosphate synthase [Bacillota bacterium]
MSKSVRIGNINIGGGAPVAVQSMTTTRPSDTENTVSQILALEKAGCDIARFCVRDEADAKAISLVREQTHIPLVADIHFDYRLAVASVEHGAHKVRINPGNIGGEDKIAAVADCVKAHKIPVRVGANTGSIEKEHLARYGRSARALVESALDNVRALERHGVRDIVISVKASDVRLMVEAYEMLAKTVDYPLHLGVTEAGTLMSGVVKNSVGIGALLLKGIGDTVRVSLSAPPVEEIYAAKRILRSVGLDNDCAEIVSCPTCGRCDWNLIEFAEKTEAFTADVKKHIKIAVMGCVVNGPGEAADADVGIAGGKDCCMIFKKGVPFKKVAYEDAEREFFKEIENCLK